MLAIGMMSGTSLDGIDVALTDLNDPSERDLKVTLLDFMTIPYPQATLERISDAMSLDKSNVSLICQLNVELGQRYAEAALDMMSKHELEAQDVRFIANHGQTIYHAPNALYPSTLQLGESAEIAQRTGVTTISNFREADIAAGGQGAPIVPFTEYILYQTPEKNRILVNIGGISNLTVLTKGANLNDIIAFDTGPGNMMIDAAMQKFYQKAYDENGAIAKTGQVNQALLETLMAHDYFKKLPPKTTGREDFGIVLTDQLFETHQLKREDWVATFTAFTVQSLSQAILELALDQEETEVIIAGGGAYNQTLLEWLKEKTHLSVMTQEDMGYSSEAKEAIAMAILGKYTLAHQINQVPSATGAKYPVVLGKITKF